MSSLIMCTAGNIDHGKTALIKSLTGFYCDTHKEEKKRGITINPGFTHLNLPDNKQLGIVDLPGHHKFIKNMLAGSFSIDFVLLVVAADDGIMPQTKEHIEILNLFGIKNGIIVITKIDTVDQELLELAIDETHEYVSNTFLKDAQIIPVSNKTMQGVEELKKVITTLTKSSNIKTADSFFRLYIDRIFSKKGIGTVITGTSLGGKIKTRSDIQLMPENRTLKIKRIESFGTNLTESIGKNRLSLNISGLSIEQFKQGMFLTDRVIPTTNIIDVTLSILSPHVLKKYSKALFYTGTVEIECKINLLSIDRATYKDMTIFAQIELINNSAIFPNDKFIIRSLSSDKTLGGGVILDSFPLKHKKRAPHLITQLKTRLSNNLIDIINVEVSKYIYPLKVSELCIKINITQNTFNNLNVPNFFLNTFFDATLEILFNDKIFKKVEDNIISSLNNYHKKFPYNKNGMAHDDLIKNIDLRMKNIGTIVIDYSIKNKILKSITPNKYTLFDFKYTISENQKNSINKILTLLNEPDLTSYSKENIIKSTTVSNQNRNEILMLLESLIEDKNIVKIENYYFSTDKLNQIKSEYIDLLQKESEGVTISTFKNLLNTNRKVTISLANYFDSIGITTRNGDLRSLGMRID